MYKKMLQQAVKCGISQERFEQIWTETLVDHADLLEMGTMSPQELDEKFRKRLVSEFPQLKQK